MLLTLILCAALIGVDQFTKYLAVQHLAPIGDAPLIPGFIGLRYLENTGAAFSILRGHQGLLIAITGVALLVVLWVLLFRRPKNKWEYIGVLFIFSGGVGNLIDRIANGYVVDFLNFEFMNFAIFNFADMLVVVGFCILAVALIYGEVKNKKAATAEGPGDDAAEAKITKEAPAPAGDADGDD